MAEAESKTSETPATAAPAASAPAQASVGAVNAALASGDGAAMGDARVHDDSKSHAAADALGAKAFTAGNQVFFGAGQHAPGTAHGDQLMAHEMTHVAQSRGVAAPQPGNFRVSDPSDHEEHAARNGQDGASAQANTIYRDITGGPAPAAAGAGPAAAPTGGATTPPPAAADPYATWKGHITGRHRAEAVTAWAGMPGDKKASVAGENAAFIREVIYTMGKDAPDVLKAANVHIDDYVYTIFLEGDFVDWLPTMRAAGLLMPFINAGPQKGTTPGHIPGKMKAWVDNAMNVTEARAMFQKFYPNIYDTATPALAFSAVPIAWTLAHVKRLYGILSHHLPVGHVQTITGGFLLQNTKGFGWFEPANSRVALPAHGGSTSAAADGAGHDMSGGTSSGASSAYTKPDGTAGTQTGLGHYEGTALHEVGHGVGERMGGNTYALNPASYPGFTELSPQQWANDLWTAPTGPVDNTVPEPARLDEAHAKKMFIHEIQHGSGTYKNDRGWFKTDPSNADMQKFVKSRYSNVPLFKWWDYLVAKASSKDNSYAWNAPDARVRGDWAYSYLTRANTPFIKMKSAAYTNKPSWYGISSPLEWFAEQYSHYYRTEKTGGGLIDPATKALLDRIDLQSFAPTNASGSKGVVYGGQGAGQGAAATGAAGGQAAGGGGQGAAQRSNSGNQNAGAPPVPTEPLFFPW